VTTQQETSNLDLEIAEHTNNVMTVVLAMFAVLALGGGAIYVVLKMRNQVD